MEIKKTPISLALICFSSLFILYSIVYGHFLFVGAITLIYGVFTGYWRLLKKDFGLPNIIYHIVNFLVTIIWITYILFFLVQEKYDSAVITKQAAFLSDTVIQQLIASRMNMVFVMKKTLSCRNMITTDPPQENQEFILDNLSAPILTKLNNTGAENFDGGFVVTQKIKGTTNFITTNYFTKLNETDTTVTMYYETIFGGIGSLILDKKRGLFVDSFAGSLNGPIGYLSVGYCE